MCQPLVFQGWKKYLSQMLKPLTQVLPHIFAIAIQALSWASYRFLLQKSGLHQLICFRTFTPRFRTTLDLQQIETKVSLTMHVTETGGLPWFVSFHKGDVKPSKQAIYTSNPEGNTGKNIIPESFGGDQPAVWVSNEICPDHYGRFPACAIKGNTFPSTSRCPSQASMQL